MGGRVPKNLLDQSLEQKRLARFQCIALHLINGQACVRNHAN
jgi:hypothetical protein